MSACSLSDYDPPPKAVATSHLGLRDTLTADPNALPGDTDDTGLYAVRAQGSAAHCSPGCRPVAIGDPDRRPVGQHSSGGHADPGNDPHVHP